MLPICGKGCKSKNLEKISEHTSNHWNLQTLSWRGKFLNLHHPPKASRTLAHLAVLLDQHDVINVMDHCDILQDVQTVPVSSYYNVTEDGKVHNALEQNSKWILLSVQHEYKLFLFRIEKNIFAKSVASIMNNKALLICFSNNTALFSSYDGATAWLSLWYSAIGFLQVPDQLVKRRHDRRDYHSVAFQALIEV